MTEISETTSALIAQLRSKLPQLLLLENEPMSRHCSFRIGGPVRLMAQPSSLSELRELLCILRERDMPSLILGNGTNLLCSDAPLDFCAVKAGEGLAYVVREDELMLRCGPGISLARLALTAAKLGLSGLEFAHGIPGSLGGAVFMNAGAYGGEMAGVVNSVTSLDREQNFVERDRSALDFSYRHSVFSESPEFITEVVLKLEHGDRDAIFSKMDELQSRRSSSQPLDMPSAGSTFKRPSVDFAARLIDEAGLRGLCVGAAQVSEKHTGFIVNRGGASFDDVIKLMDIVSEKVYSSSGIRLEPEVRIIR